MHLVTFMQLKFWDRKAGVLRQFAPQVTGWMLPPVNREQSSRCAQEGEVSSITGFSILKQTKIVLGTL